MDEDKIEKGLVPSPDDIFWMGKMQELAGKSLESIEAAAKQLIAMITTMQGIYAAVLAFSGISTIPKGSKWAAFFYALPILLWLVSLFFGLQVFKTRKYKYYEGSPDSAKDTFQKISDYKHDKLDWAYSCFAFGFLIALVGIMYWLYKGATG